MQVYIYTTLLAHTDLLFKGDLVVLYELSPSELEGGRRKAIVIVVYSLALEGNRKANPKAKISLDVALLN